MTKAPSREHQGSGSACRTWLSGICLFFGVLFFAEGLLAHTRSTSYSTWELRDDRVRVLFRIPQLELTRLPWGVVSPPTLVEPLGNYLVGALRFEVDGVACPLVAGPRALASPPERALIEWELQCPSTDGARSITTDVLREVAPSHLHFARLRGADGMTERVLTAAERSWDLANPDSSGASGAIGSSLTSYLVVGVEHIATGYDHLVFLLGLLLLARRIRDVITIATGFTVAHSLTLGLAAMGRVQPDGAAIESLIGLSIALVAAENAWLLSGKRRIVPLVVTGVLGVMAAFALAGWGRIPPVALLGLALFSACYFALLHHLGAPLRLRTGIAFCFGLIHGFGFAGVLMEMALPQERMVLALLGFNLGVELGQVVIICAVWPLLALLLRWREAAHRSFVEWGTAVVCGLGVFWMVTRAYGA